MRDIKFKAFNKWGMSKPLDMFEMTRHEEDGAEYSDDTVFLQYTGLVDKSGIGIYEGDILKADGDVFEGEVIFDQSSAVWSCYVYRNQKKVELMTLVRFMHQRARAVSSTPEIIGNIYENPELITQE